MANKKGKAKAKSGARPKQSSSSSQSSQKILPLSVEDPPLLLRDKQGKLLAGIKLESKQSVKDSLVLSGWTLGSNRLSLLCDGKEHAAEIKHLPRADVLTAFSLASELLPGFEIVVALPVSGQLGLRWTFSGDDDTWSVDFQILDNSGKTSAVGASTGSGAVDGLLNDVVHGWAWNSSQPDSRVTVEFLLDDVVIGQSVCDKPREDLQAAGIGDGKHGFSWSVPELIAPADASRIAVRIAGTATNLSGVLKACYSSLPATRCYDGKLDLAWPHYLAGTLIPLGQPLPEFLEVLVNDEVVSQLGIRRGPDLRGKLGRAGSFHWQVPAMLSHIPAAAVEIRLPGQRLLELARMQEKSSAAEPAINTLANADADTRPVLGLVERVSADGVEGWAWNPNQPDVPVDLAIRVDGEVAGITRANRFAARLRGEGRSGHQYFSWPFPPALQNGRKCQVTVEDINSGVQLKAKDKVVEFPLVYMAMLGDQQAADKSANTVFAPDWHGSWAKRLVLNKPARRSAPHSGIRISMLMLNWNGAGMLEDFLASLERHQPVQRYELLIVDHGSKDKSLAVIKRYAKKLPIKLIERGANYSYASSNNLAAKSARGEYLLFLNNDLVLQQDCATEMAALLADQSIGIVGARLLEPLKEAGGQWSFVTHHQGVRFKVDTLPGTTARYYAPQELHDVPAELHGSVLQMPAVTAALMMCRKSEFLAKGGFYEDYFYGMEDVDFCLNFQRHTGKQIVCALNVAAIHNRSATRELKLGDKQPAAAYNATTHLDNRRTFIRRHGRALSRTIVGALLGGETRYRQQPLRVTFAVTRADINTEAGDFYTALELGNWLHKKFGWEVCFLEKDHYSIPGTDVLVAMRHDLELLRIEGGNPGLLTVAWIRNRTEQWLARPEFDDYNLVFASSSKIVEHVQATTRRKAILLPIATNPERFAPAMADPEYASDVVFTGNNHGAARTAVELLDLKQADFSFAIYGHNWDKHKKLHRYVRGALPYHKLPSAYASTKLVIDDAHPVTRDWHSLNSRIFDAIASGKVVLTNCIGGAQELFGKKLPVFASAKQLNQSIKALLKDDRKREKLARDLRKIVLAKHTYEHRAQTFKQSLVAFHHSSTLRFSIKVPVPHAAEKEQWGDYHFALGIKRALERKGHLVRIDLLPDWYAGISASDDVVIVLRGLSRYQPQPTTINFMWLISHPEEVALEELRQFDHVFVASELYTKKLAKELSGKVSCLLQCTDKDLFYPDKGKDIKLPDVLFVGNSRGQQRAAVSNAIAGKADFGIYGTGWKGRVPPRHWLGEYIPNQQLRRYYSTAKVLLNDHWPDMKREGFISNRLFDAGACGAVVLTDDVAGLRKIFGDLALVYDSTESFQEMLAKVLTDAGLRKQISDKISKAVLAQHTFDHRVVAILDKVSGINSGKQKL